MLNWFGILWIGVPLLAGCVDKPPAIGGSFRGPLIGVDSAFDQALKARFPVGSDEEFLRAELLRELFSISKDDGKPSGFVARYAAQDFPCRVRWIVRWGASAGKIAMLQTAYRQDCL